MNHHKTCLPVPARETIRWLSMLMPLTALAAGCVFVAPVPTAYHAEGSRRNLTEDTATRFTCGRTTIDDVVLILGEPDEAASDASWLTYQWERVNMHLAWGWFIPLGQVAIGQSWERTAAQAHSLALAFDECGVLQTVKTTINFDVRTTGPP